MPLKEEHLNLAEKNLDLLSRINKFNDFWDWQVTICFYTALHFIDAYLSLHGFHFEKHKRVLNLLNPFSMHSFKLNQNDYLSYRSLFGLSLRARYLCSHKENSSKKSPIANLTYSIHLSKAIKHLDKIINFAETKLSYRLPSKCSIKCDDINQSDVKYFIITK